MLVELDGAGERAVVGERDRRHLELGRAGGEVRDPAGPVEDRELGVDVEVDELGGQGRAILAGEQDVAAARLSSPLRVILLPGIVLPAEAAYGALIARSSRGRGVAKDPVYATPEPPEDYSLDEVAGVLREADARGWGRFHLVGYSGGGAAALRCAHADRLTSLALLEPPGREPGTQSRGAAGLEQERLASFRTTSSSAFVRFGVRPGVSPPAPPPGDPPPWMAKRPAGIRAILRAFRTAPSIGRRCVVSIDPSTSR